MIKIKEELTEEKKKQREKIREFEKLQISYQHAGLPPQIAGWIGYLFCVVASVCPAQAYFEEKDGVANFFILVYLWVVMGGHFFMMPYMQFQEHRKTVLILQKIKYLPVDIKEIKIVWLGYLMNYVKRLFWIALVSQFAMALLLFHRISIWNLLAVGAIAGLPFLMIGLTILCSHYPQK